MHFKYGILDEYQQKVGFGTCFDLFILHFKKLIVLHNVFYHIPINFSEASNSVSFSESCRLKLRSIVMKCQVEILS